MRVLFHALLLSLFWVVLSGHLDSALLLGLGAASVLLVLWFIRRMDATDRVPSTLYPTPRLAAYVAWLMGCVVKANVDLARRIWAPSLPIRPGWERLETRVTSPMEKTLYANSITLTPGTLTTDVREDHLLIHSLTPEGMEELRQGEMERRIRRLGV